jgi:hypothetical protein
MISVRVMAAGPSLMACALRPPSLDAEDTASRPTTAMPSLRSSPVAVSLAAAGFAIMLLAGTHFYTDDTSPRFMEPRALLSLALNDADEPVAPILPSPAGGSAATKNAPCADNEELFAGLCYKRCSALTSGSHSLRLSEFTCQCDDARDDCLEPKLSGSTSCQGHSVSGQGGCPYSPTSCPPGEEPFRGQCYTTCSSLTSGRFSRRIGKATCVSLD